MKSAAILLRPMGRGAVVASAAVVAGLSTTALGATLSVGPGKTYAKPCEAIAAAHAGDVIEVDAAGNYSGDACVWTTDNLVIRGVNGRAKIDDTNLTVAAGKGIFVDNAPNATIENFELAGAVVPDNNGAGIRTDGGNLTVRNCYFHDNQDGILGSPTTAGQYTVTIEYSEFANNGAGDGFSHNMYIGDYGTFVLRYSYSHGAKVGQLVKTRAYNNFILYNRLTDEPGTTASYEIDIPNGGNSFVIGNLIEQSPQSQNDTIIETGAEGAKNPFQNLYVVNNTIVNDLGKGTFVVSSGAPTTLINNIFSGGGGITNGTNATLRTNFDDSMGNPMLVDPAHFDYHLKAGSPCVDKGSDPGAAGSQSLVPDHEYVHPAGTEGRAVVGNAIDIGAYELGGAVPLGDAGALADAGGTGASGMDSGRSNPSGTDSGSQTAAGDAGLAPDVAAAEASTTGGAGTAQDAGSDVPTGGASSGSVADSSASSGSGGPASDGGSSGQANMAAGGGCGCASVGNDGVSALAAHALGALAMLGSLARRRKKPHPRLH
jgi:MYXO-CTERM domain-containing protein